MQKYEISLENKPFNSKKHQVRNEPVLFISINAFLFPF